MSKVMLTSRVGSDGVLNVQIPLAMEDANKTVRVIVETIDVTTAPANQPLSHEEWLKFIANTAGKWQGGLERPENGDLPPEG